MDEHGEPRTHITLAEFMERFSSGTIFDRARREWFEKLTNSESEETAQQRERRRLAKEASDGA